MHEILDHLLRIGCCCAVFDMISLSPLVGEASGTSSRCTMLESLARLYFDETPSHNNVEAVEFLGIMDIAVQLTSKS